MSDKKYYTMPIERMEYTQDENITIFYTASGTQYTIVGNQIQEYYEKTRKEKLHERI